MLRGVGGRMTSLYLGFKRGKSPTEGIDSTKYEGLANTQWNGVIKLIVQYTTGNRFNLGMSRRNLAIECLRSSG